VSGVDGLQNKGRGVREFRLECHAEIIPM
jgi:hypothetical protein